MAKRREESRAGLPTETVDIEDIKPHPRNYRAHPQDQLDHIKRSIQDHGVYRNVVVARDGTILAGHGVVAALRQLGAKEVTVVRLDVDPGDPKALKVLTGDNEIPRLGEVDDRLLTELLAEVQNVDGVGLVGTGFDEMMLANLVFVTRPEREVEDFNAAAHWVGLPGYVPVEEPLKVVVSFKNEADRDRFMSEIGSPVVHKKVDKTLCIWWPSRPKDVLADKKFVAEGEAKEAEAANG